MKIKNIISCGAASVMLVCFSSINALALDKGTYEVDTVTHYINPDTGLTDDGGTGNSELGEGMCRSAVYEKAIVEKSAGDVTVTMRMLLYSNLSDIHFAVQEAPGGGYRDIQYSVIKESAASNSADLRFSISDEDSYIRVKMYVGPMGRDVTFYWNCDTSSAVESDGALPEIEAPETGSSLFVDIDGHWAENEIVSVVEAGLFNGTTELTFSPEDEMTRGMFVTVLGRLSGEDISGESSFADVDKSMYYSPYIAWANENDIVNGYENNIFAPDAPVTVEQAAVIIMRYADYKSVELKTKSISPSTTGISSWAQDTVVKAGKAGIITKQNTNGYDYTSSATRADIASMLSNFTQYYGN
ncbi:MAG: heme-binding Shp domain-containing protein [Candidatus Ornithomonoglobus sp.]